MLAGLAAAGFAEGPSFRIHRYNALGDAVTLNSIAQAIVGGDDELVITLSTPSLQAVAAANRDMKRAARLRDGKRPGGLGVGIARDDPRKHPPYMVGLGTMQPVAETFRMARRLAPGLARSRSRLEPVGGEFRSRARSRPDSLQGAGRSSCSRRPSTVRRPYARRSPRWSRRGAEADLGRGR